MSKMLDFSISSETTNLLVDALRHYQNQGQLEEGKEAIFEDLLESLETCQIWFGSFDTQEEEE